MEIKRTIKTEVQKFQTGDTFTFKMKDGEKVKARAVQEDKNGNMLFIFEDCLKDEYTMNQILNEGVMGKIYKRMPKKIRKKMAAFENGEYLRLPTEKEIFGINEYGEEDDEEVVQFECMKNRKYRIAFQGYGADGWEWYWLENKKNNSKSNSASRFCGVNSGGYSSFDYASIANGVRPLFMMENI